MTLINHKISNTASGKTPIAPAVSFTELVRERRSFAILKRVLDIVIASILILTILTWLIPIVSLLILIDSRSPVFFRQRRVGRFGRPFYCLKFRTMYKNIEADYKQATDDDPRITGLGHFLRKTNIDELPQLFNVLMGDMSIVGPRPHMYKDCRDFNAVVKNYKLRTLIKPGITGLAQIKGFRGPTQTELSITQRFKWELFYLKKASLLLDVVIILITTAQTITHFFTIVYRFTNGKNYSGKKISIQSKKQIAA